jgi:hypothetical protein
MNDEWRRPVFKLNQKPELIVPIFDFMRYVTFCAGRLFFFTSVPGTLFLRASCFTLRLCFATPLDGRLRLVVVFSGIVFIVLLL